ncbi:MAG: ureidoglycolate lyase, partial [Gammaproteobacteria bacterium]
LIPQPLTSEAFAPFGEVIDLRCAKTQDINFGLTTRFHDLATVDTSGENGRPLINVFRSNPLPMPHQVKIMERHPLGSQAFIPMHQDPYLILVGSGEQEFEPDSLKLFITDGLQGVNYYTNTWHHYQMVIKQTADFVVIDRGGSGNNLEEVELLNGPTISTP